MGLSSKLRFSVFQRDNFTCRYCGRKTPEAILEVDHVIPRVEGGGDEIENLVASCFECNRGKGRELLNGEIQEGDIHERTVILAEREMQLREYNHLREQIKSREDGEIGKLKELFESGSSYCNPYYFPSRAVRTALRCMSWLDVGEYLELAQSKITDAGQWRSRGEAVGRYFAGILWNQIKEHGNARLSKNLDDSPE